MAKIIDLTGQTFGKLLVAKYSRSNKAGKAMFSCLCDCGNMVEVVGYSLRSGETRSCGCLLPEVTIERSTKHGFKTRANKHSIYDVWTNMRDRCNNPNNESYHRYGGRGIEVCERWNDFELFLKDMGNKPKPYFTIERKNNNGNYEPGNCKWGNDYEQANNRSNNLKAKVFNIDKTAAQITKISGLSYSCVRDRIAAGKENEDLLSPTREPKTINFNGESLTITEWAEKLNIKANSFYKRLKINNYNQDYIESYLSKRLEAV